MALLLSLFKCTEREFHCPVGSTAWGSPQSAEKQFLALSLKIILIRLHVLGPLTQDPCWSLSITMIADGLDSGCFSTADVMDQTHLVVHLSLLSLVYKYGSEVAVDTWQANSMDLFSLFLSDNRNTQ